MWVGILKNVIKNKSFCILKNEHQFQIQWSFIPKVLIFLNHFSNVLSWLLCPNNNERNPATRIFNKTISEVTQAVMSSQGHRLAIEFLILVVAIMDVVILHKY